MLRKVRRQWDPWICMLCISAPTDRAEDNAGAKTFRIRGVLLHTLRPQQQEFYNRMKHRTRKVLVNFTLFLLALVFILYIGRAPSSKNGSFAWTTIRYQTTSATLPDPHGICPGLSGSTKPALVVSRVAADGNGDWLNALKDSYHLCIYDVDAPLNSHSTQLEVPANRGHEAMAYLTFLIDNYETIPSAGAVFVHGARWAWHNDHPEYDNLALLSALNVSAAVAETGYHNLRCDWSASMCSPDYAPPQGSLETSLDARMKPWDARVAADAAMPRVLEELFGSGSGAGGTDDSSKVSGGKRSRLGRNDAVRAQCCAQFVVARDRIWHHSRSEYVALRQWLLDSDSGAPRDDRVAGRILSYIWHILFIRPIEAEDDWNGNLMPLPRLNALACPRADECYCRLYGRCNLGGCTSPGQCHGQYHLPPNFKLPENWAAMHQ